MRGRTTRILSVFVLLFWACGVFAAAPTSTEKYYAPLDKLATNTALLSRNKEAPTSSDERFPFSASEYAARMSKIKGFSWDDFTSSHLNRLTGPYGDKTFDALGVYAELHSKISEEFRERQVPEMYMLLAPMLSGMNVHYVSPDGKRGIWQLDIITATRYGLVVNTVLDERDDPVLSARAAASYIKDLQSQFRSPEAILWAYIGSPAEVRRAFARAESADAKRAMAYLPDYLKQASPIFAAWNFIWTYAEKDNLPVFMPAVFLPYETAMTSGKTHLGQISEVLEIPLSSLRELNPTLKKSYVDDKGTVNLPQGYAARFLAEAALISKYKDTLYFRPEVIVKPVAPTYATTGSYTPSTTLNTTVKKYHKVKSGETLSQIAQKYHVSVSSLKKWNHLRSSTIRAGQKIVVNVTVQNRVADKEDKTVRENIQIEGTTSPETNEQNNDNQINAGGTPPNNTTVVQPKVETKPTPPKPKTSGWIYHTVKSGETLSSIGRRYGVPYTKIKEWNGLRSDKLSIGQKLKIKK